MTDTARTATLLPAMNQLCQTFDGVSIMVTARDPWHLDCAGVATIHRVVYRFTLSFCWLPDRGWCHDGSSRIYRHEGYDRPTVRACERINGWCERAIADLDPEASAVCQAAREIEHAERLGKLDSRIATVQTALAELRAARAEIEAAGPASTRDELTEAQTRLERLIGYQYGRLTRI